MTDSAEQGAGGFCWTCTLKATKEKCGGGVWGFGQRNLCSFPLQIMSVSIMQQVKPPRWGREKGRIFYADERQFEMWRGRGRKRGGSRILQEDKNGNVPLLLNSPVSKLPAGVWGEWGMGGRKAEERVRVGGGGGIWGGGDVPAVFDRSQGWAVWSDAQGEREGGSGERKECPAPPAHTHTHTKTHRGGQWGRPLVTVSAVSRQACWHGPGPH